MFVVDRYVMRAIPLAFMLLFFCGCALAPGMDKANTFVDSGSYQGVDVISYEINANKITTLVQEYDAPQENIPNVPENLVEYRVAPQDVLAITVWDHPELTTPAGASPPPELLGNTVRNDGTLFYPYVGVVKVAGMTVEEVRLLLTHKLKHYVEEPQVDVRVVAYRSQFVYVTGEVAAPKTLPITNTVMRVLDAINLVGGATSASDLSQVKLIRKNGSVEKIDLAGLQYRGKLEENKVLFSGDHLFVPDNRDHKVFVTGEVKQAGAIPMGYNGYSLADALGDAGGLNMETSNPSHIYVVRGFKADGARDGKVENINIYHLDADTPEGLIFADSFFLEPRDVIFVSAAGVARWGRVLNNLASTVQALSISRLFVK